jgi:PAS domain-containing protein
VERARAEEKLRESEAHLQLALKVGRMGTWDSDMQTDALLWSEGHFTVLGLQPNECEPSYEVWASRVHPDDLAEAEAKYQQAIADNKEFHHEYRCVGQMARFTGSKPEDSLLMILREIPSTRSELSLISQNASKQKRRCVKSYKSSTSILKTLQWQSLNGIETFESFGGLLVQSAFWAGKPKKFWANL